MAFYSTRSGQFAYFAQQLGVRQWGGKRGRCEHGVTSQDENGCGMRSRRPESNYLSSPVESRWLRLICLLRQLVSP